MADGSSGFDVNSVFQRLQKADAQKAQVQRQLSFQATVVRKIVQYAAPSMPITAIQRGAAMTHDDDGSSFLWFHHQFPRFPIRLFSYKAKESHTATIGQLFGKTEFRKLGWWKAFETAADSANIQLQSERMALFFNLPYAADATIMVLHNQPCQDYSIRDASTAGDEHWPRLIYPMKNGVIAVLEPMNGFLRTVGKDWAE